jgi:non-histone protein 10
LSTPSQPRRLKNAFDLYCNENRPILASEHQKEIAEGTYDIERVLATGWSSLSSVPKADYMNRYEQIKKQADVEKDVSKSTGPRQMVFDAATRHVDEDVEMGEDAEDAGTPSAAGEGGGFTAVNRT